MSFEREVERALHDNIRIGDLRLPSVDVIEGLASGEVRTLDQRRTGRNSRDAKYSVLVAAIFMLVVAGGFVVAQGGSKESAVGTSAGGAQSGPAFGMISSSGQAPLDAGEINVSGRAALPVHIYRESSTGGTLAIFGPGQRGAASVDSLAARYEPLMIEEIAAEASYPGLLSNGLLLVRWGSDSESYLLAARDLADDVVTAVAALILDDPDAVVPSGFELVYSGPDLNPFTGGTGLERSVRYEDGTAYTYLPGVQTLEDYLWFLEDLRLDRIDDRAVVIREGNGRVIAYWQEPGGVAIAESDGENLADTVRVASPADESTWAAAKSRSTSPGAFHQSATTTMPG